MKYVFFYAFLLAALSSTSCDKTEFKEIVRNPGSGENAEDGSLGENGEGRHVFKVTATDTEKKIGEPVEILFVLDNSRSMFDNISKLKLSIEKLFNDLNANGLPYTARILTMDMLLDILQDQPQPNSKVPYKLFASNKPDFNRGSFDAVYRNVGIYDASAGPGPFLNALDAVISANKLIDNEPGICLAMDYVNWLSLNTAVAGLNRFSDKQKIHVVLLSDEDNTNKFQTFNHTTNAVTSSKDMICYQENTFEQSCTNKPYTKNNTWTQNCYSHDYVNYSGKYKAIGQCDAQGHGDDDLKTLSSTSGCVTEQFKCTNNLAPTAFSCKAGNYTVASDKRGQSRCEQAQFFNCKQFYDGQTVYQVKNRNDALSLIASGAECTAMNFSLADIANGQTSQPGVRSCEAYTCSATAYAIEYPLKAALAAAPAGKYTCDAQPINTSADRKPAFIVNKNAANGKLTGIQAVSCPAHYTLKSLPSAALSADKFCKKNIDQVGVPANVLLVDAGRSTTIEQSYNKNFPKIMSGSEIAASLGIATVNLLTWSENPTSAKGDLGCYTYQLPTSHPAQAYLNLRQVPSVHNNVRDDVLAPPSGNDGFGVARQRLGDVISAKVYQPSGNYTETTCSDPVETHKYYEPTAENFQEVMRKLHPLKSISWHSIVNTSGSACASGETNYAKGSEYMKLSGLSDGVASDVCADSFDSFVKKVSLKVLKEVDVAYTMPKLMIDKKIVSVKNQKTKKFLVPTTDYWVADKNIVFNKKAIQAGDEILVIFE